MDILLNDPDMTNKYMKIHLRLLVIGEMQLKLQ